MIAQAKVSEHYEILGAIYKTPTSFRCGVLQLDEKFVYLQLFVIRILRSIDELTINILRVEFVLQSSNNFYKNNSLSLDKH